MSRARRKEREAFGRTAETIAVWWLRLRGYRILRRRFRTAAGEIDIVARRGSVVVAVEVKARPSPSLGAEAVSAHQQQRIARTAAQFLARQPDSLQLGLRFDLIVVSPWRLPVHLADAWRPASDARW